MKKMSKVVAMCALGVLTAVILFWTNGADVYAGVRTIDEEELVELQGVLNEFISHRQSREFDGYLLDGFDLDINPHSIGIEHSLLGEFAQMISNANVSVSESRGGTDPVVIRTFGPPQPGFDNFYVVTFTSEAYLVFVDALLEYTGIPAGMLRASVHEEGEWFGLGTGDPIGYVDDYGNEVLYDEEKWVRESEWVREWQIENGYIDANDRMESRFPGTYPMGTPIRINVQGSLTPATLGHSANSMGIIAFTASHGVTSAGNVIRHEGNQFTIGHIRPGNGFAPGIGLDAAAINMADGYRVSTRIPHLGRDITNFFAPIGGNSAAWVYPRSAQGRHVTGAVTRINHSMIANIFGTNRQFHGVIEYQSRDGSTFWSGDSGAALICNTHRAAGSLFAGINGSTTAYFSPATVYRQLVN